MGAWKPRKRKWPGAGLYWVVTDGEGRALVGPNGMPSHFSDKDQAQHWATVLNEGHEPEHPKSIGRDQ